MCNPSQDSRYGHLGSPQRVWTLAAIHGDVERLRKLHDGIWESFEPGDRLVYTGNYTGYGENSAESVDEILTFRRMVLAQRGVFPDHITYLRGAQEEMWDKLLQLPFAPNPTDVLLWMLGNGLSATLRSYGLCPHDGIEACRRGTMDLTKWIHSIRAAVRKHAGHDTFHCTLRRAAMTQEESAYPMLFIHAGLDASKPLDDQGDRLWWGGNDFDRMDSAYKPFEKVVRGYDPKHRGVKMNCITATIDGGCGFGGSLIGAGFNPDGSVEAMLDA